MQTVTVGAGLGRRITLLCPVLSAFEQRLNSSDTHWVVRCYWPDGFRCTPGMTRLPVTHTRGAFYFGDNRMREDNEYVARAAVCEQRAKEARTESEKQSWLVMADSWRETVKLQEMLTRHAEFIRKVPMPRASGA